MILNIQNTVIAFALALVIGFSAGYYTKGEFAKANQFEAVIDVQHQTAQGIEQSLKTSSAVETEVTASNQKVEVIRKAVAKRIQPKESTNEANLQTSAIAQCPWSIDIGTVRLLNAARSGGAIDPPSSAMQRAKNLPALNLPTLSTATLK